MSSYEIDNILRIQDMQLQSLHPYIEDFYFQNYLNKQAGMFGKKKKKKKNINQYLISIHFRTS